MTFRFETKFLTHCSESELNELSQKTIEGGVIKGLIKNTKDGLYSYRPDKIIITTAYPWWHKTIVGWCYINKSETHNVLGIFVCPEYRRQGLGSELMNIMKGYAKANNLIYFVNPFDYPGRQFFLKTNKEKLNESQYINGSID